MKRIKLAMIVALSGALTVLIVGVVSAAPGRSNPIATQTAAVRNTDESMNLIATSKVTHTHDLSDTDDLTETHWMTHPVGLAISLCFSDTYSHVQSLRDEGFGYGEIARAYFLARWLNGSVTPQQILDQINSGLGWGEIMKQYAFKPGRDNNLGAIMSGHHSSSGSDSFNHDNSNIGGANHNNQNNGSSSCPGNSCNSPGHDKRRGSH